MKPTNTLLYKMAQRAKEMANMTMPLLRKCSEYEALDLGDGSRGAIIEAVLIEEFESAADAIDGELEELTPSQPEPAENPNLKFQDLKKGDAILVLQDGEVISRVKIMTSNEIYALGLDDKIQLVGINPIGDQIGFCHGTVIQEVKIVTLKKDPNTK